MTFIRDIQAFKTAQLFLAQGYPAIAQLYLKKAYGL